MSWIYRTTEIKELFQIPENAVGFVYIIVNNQTNQWYIGKKSLYSHITKPPLKGYKRKRKVTKESDWKTYMSSSDIVKEWTDIRKEILQFAFSKKELTYLETKYLFNFDALEDEYCVNSNILGKFFR